MDLPGTWRNAIVPLRIVCAPLPAKSRATALEMGDRDAVQENPERVRLIRRDLS
jgi:hypothetical protein